jgi:hypothetical protein
MKTAWCCLLLVLIAASGCVELPTLWDNPKPKPAGLTKKAPSGPVSADQVTESNAYEKVDELRQELERDATPKAMP